MNAPALKSSLEIVDAIDTVRFRLAVVTLAVGGLGGMEVSAEQATGIESLLMEAERSLGDIVERIHP
jgi:hypothetical protein